MSSSSSSSSYIKVSSYTDEPVAAVGSFFNGLSIPSSTEFDIYKNKKTNNYILHGETDHLEYNGDSVTNQDLNDYVVAMYDPNTKSVELFKAPYFQTKVTSKQYKVYKGPSVRSTGVKNVTQRNALGEAFGTKKAKQAITNLEKNRIDADKLQDMEMDIIDSVQESITASNNSGSNMGSTSKNSTGPQADDFSNSPIPKPNVDATNVEYIYPIKSIIPAKDWNYIRVQSILTDSDPISHFPSSPEFIKQQLPTIIDQGNLEKLQILYYTSLLFAIYENRRVSSKDQLMTKLNNTPSEALIDTILQNFTIARTSKFGKSKDRSFTIDPHNEDKLLCYLIILILHLSNFSVALNPLARDLKLKPTKLVALFRAVGAIIKSATVGEAEALGIPKSSVGTYKIAHLKVPFKMPELTRRRGGGGARR
ncbi:RPA49 [Candida margitis]|uniref:RPA49 n=1 Tax=Candida margitis TaxID=1775924 RepID=UPI002226C01D|nr:RPA49 [Candida margitis]KAI5954064.1 RPA49 [Candida margitis]